MWAVREIADNTIAIGHFGGSNFKIYEGNTEVATKSIGLSIFGFLIPPNMSP